MHRVADNNGEMDYDSAVDNGKRQEQAMDDAMMLAFICLAGNVGIVSGIPPPQNNRHADMSRDMLACRRRHVGDIKPCRLLRCRVDVVSA